MREDPRTRASNFGNPDGRELNCVPVLLVARRLEKEIDAGLHQVQSREREDDVAITLSGVAIYPLVNNNWHTAN